MATAGVGWMTPEQGLEALEQVLREDAGSVAAAALDWAVPAAPGRRRPAFLRELTPVGEDEAPEASGRLRTRPGGNNGRGT